LPTILNSVPNVELIIIGGGPLMGELKETRRTLGLESQVKFLGYMKYSNVMRFLSDCHIGLAPYSTSDKTSLTTDPLKPKLYMACALPVIITNLSEIASEIAESEAGLVVRYDKDELAEVAVKLLTDVELFKKCSKNALKVACRYEWNNIFDKAFNRIINK
jgi:glycosyltransferase involved in cell wall biosynthesis